MLAQAFRILKRHKLPATSVVVTPDGKRAVLTSQDEFLEVWDLEAGRILRTLEGHANRVNAVAVTPDGRRVVSGSEDQTLRVWDLETGEEIISFGGSGSFLCVAVVQRINGLWVVAGDEGGAVWVFKTAGC